MRKIAIIGAGAAGMSAAVFAAAAAGVYRDIPAAQSALLHYE